MSRWFRHYAGMMRDDKLVRVAIRSKQTIERVAWIWGAILESAAEIDDGGRFDVDAAEVAYFLRADEADVGAILSALADAGRLAEGVVVKWGNRQFSSDRSKERVAAHRQRKRAGEDRSDSQGDAGNGDVTLHEPSGNAPDTETELETESTPPTPRSGGRDRGSKIPEDWVPPVVADLSPQAKGCAEQWTEASYAAEAEAFRNYWIGESGSKARKSNWGSAWANRIIQIHGRVMKDQKFGNAPTGTPGPAVPMNDNDWNAMCDRCADRSELMGKHDEARDWRAKKRGVGAANDRSRKPQAIGDLVGRMAMGAHH